MIFCDNPLLIAAQKVEPETLQYLISCGIDILSHRRDNDKLTAIKLALDKERFENVLFLLDADSPFPDDFDLKDIEKKENTAALKKEVEERCCFHLAIKDSIQPNVK
jgi:hypothetical protein